MKFLIYLQSPSCMPYSLYSSQAITGNYDLEQEYLPTLFVRACLHMQQNTVIVGLPLGRESCSQPQLPATAYYIVNVILFFFILQYL